MKARHRAKDLQAKFGGPPLYMAIFNTLMAKQNADAALKELSENTAESSSTDVPSDDVSASAKYAHTPLNAPQKWCGRWAPVARSALNTKPAPRRSSSSVCVTQRTLSGKPAPQTLSSSVRDIQTRRHSETRRRGRGKRRGMIGTSCLLQEEPIYEELQVSVHDIEDSSEATHMVRVTSPVKELVQALAAAHVGPRWDRAVRGITMGGIVLNEHATWADQGVESNAQLIWRPLKPEEVETAQEIVQCNETTDDKLTSHELSKEAQLEAWGRRRWKVPVASAYAPAQHAA